MLYQWRSNQIFFIVLIYYLLCHYSDFCVILPILNLRYLVLWMSTRKLVILVVVLEALIASTQKRDGALQDCDLSISGRRLTRHCNTLLHAITIAKLLQPREGIREREMIRQFSKLMALLLLSMMVSYMVILSSNC